MDECVGLHGMTVASKPFSSIDRDADFRVGRGQIRLHRMCDFVLKTLVFKKKKPKKNQKKTKKKKPKKKKKKKKTEILLIHVKPQLTNN